MNNAEFDKKMAFIVKQQAQFTADIQQLGEVQGQLQATQFQTENVVGRLAHATLEGFRDVNAKIDALVDAQIKLTESQAQTDKNVALTDENLRNQIAVVDRYFSDGRNVVALSSEQGNPRSACSTSPGSGLYR